MSRRFSARRKSKMFCVLVLGLPALLWCILAYKFMLQAGVQQRGFHSSRESYYARNSVASFANGTRVVWKRQRPPLRDLISKEDDKVIGDVSFLLQFAIVGHGKCGTTAIADWLSQNPQVRIPKQETLELALGTVTEFISRVYIDHPPGRSVNGYKCPGDIRSPKSIRALSQYFPKTVLIIGIRHPVLWFESLFNFKVQNLRPQFPSDYWGDPNKLIGKCTSYRDFMCVGTAKGLFHLHLAQLGKTPNTQSLERQYSTLVGNIIKTENPVFLFDVEQLADTNEERVVAFRKDLENLVGLSTPLSSTPPRIKPGKKLSKDLQESRDKHKIDICDPEYNLLRNELMKISMEASDWILHSGFLDHPDVHVSSPEYFRDILDRHWKADPCPR
jgi:hypothetical protein